MHGIFVKLPIIVQRLCSFSKQLLHLDHCVPPFGLVFLLQFRYSLKKWSRFKNTLQFQRKNQPKNCWWKFTLLLKFFKMEEMGCRMLVGGTALLSFLYHVSKTLTSIPWLSSSACRVSNSELRTYVGMGLYPYFCPRKTYENATDIELFTRLPL